MRKIRTQEEIERAEKRRGKIFVFFMLLILVTSTAGYAFFSNPSADSKENANTLNEGDKWNFKSGENTYSLTYSPESVKNIEANFSFPNSEYSGKVLYIASESDEIINEIGSTLGRYASRIQKACYETCEKNLPEKNCSSSLIVWNKSDKNKIYQREKCIFIEGDLRSVDAFLYKVLGIS
ncbi:MAG: hypothetical protein AABW65_02815 [Nanoarchaeota archaeon]